MEAKCKCEAGAPKWLVTFADLMSLLLAFFVLLLSFSSIQEAKFHELAGSLRGAFGVLQSQQSITINESPPRPNITMVQIQQNLISEQIEKLKREGEKSGSNVEVEGSGNELRVRLRHQMLFPSGSGALLADATALIDELATLLAITGGSIDIEGHTDNRPISNATYLSNWELSSARSMALLRSLETRGIPPPRMSASAFGEYHPLAPNTSRENRARNRRVELRIEIDPKIATPEFLESLNGSLAG